MSEQKQVTRRELLAGAAAAALSPGVVAGAQHEHQAPKPEQKAAGGPYRPKCFQEHEYRTLQELAGLIIPVDEHSAGAVAAGAPEYIDLLASQNAELAAIFTGGLAWLDREMEKRSGKTFADAAESEQTALLDLIAYRRNDSPELGPGLRFFEWARALTVDAYYTSKAGIADLGYKGNKGMSQFQVPEEAVRIAVERSGLG